MTAKDNSLTASEEDRFDSFEANILRWVSDLDEKKSVHQGLKLIRKNFIPLSKHNEEIKIKEEGAFSYGQEREKQVWLSRINSIQEKAEKELKELTWIGSDRVKYDRQQELKIIIKTCKEIKGEIEEVQR